MIANNYKFISFLVACMFCFLGSEVYSQAYSWANSAGGSTGQDYGYSTAVDANGNVVVGGVFRGTVDFDPSAAVFNLVNTTTVDNGSVTKYDANGAFLWAFKIGATGVADAAQVYGVATDATGNVYVTGRFKGTADFNPDAIITNNLTAVGSSYDMFVAKYDANGAYIWAFNMGGTQDDDSRGVAVDNNGNVYLVGMFQGNMDFDPSAATFSLTVTGGVGYDISISKYTTAGAFVFAQRIGGTSSDRGFGIALDGNNDIIITGRSASTNLDADPSAAVATFVTNGVEDAFVAKYDNNGAYQWATLMGSTGVDEGLNVATDAANNVYAVGRFAISLDADPSANVVALASAGGLDGYLIKYNSAGQYQAGFRLGSTSGDEIQSVFVDANSVYITGGFNGTVDFDPSVSNVASLNPANTSNDIFVATYDFSLNYLAAFNAGGANSDLGYDIFVQNNNIHVCGGFQATADFNPSPATNNLISNGVNDMFIAKYTPCTQPTSPTAATSVSLICGNSSAILSVTAGSLGSASNWTWYENACSGASIGTGATLTVNPTVTTTYYVRAEGGCVTPSACAMSTITVSAAPTLTLSAVNLTCAGQSNGLVNASAAAGVTPYTFIWSNNATSQNITGLAQGTYSTTVTDAQGCSSTASATITEPAALSLNLVVNDVDCGGNNTGDVSSVVNGGTSPYSYLWTNNSTTANLNDIAAGTYTVTVIDFNACTILASATVVEPSILTIMVSNSSNPTGCGTATGSINTMGMGGAAPYSFNINGNTFTSNSNFTNLASGIYTVGVLDDNGCFSTTSITLSDPSGISVSVNATNVSCFAGDNGAAMANVTGNSGTINYMWSDGQMSMTATGLIADTYTVTVTDANNCSAFGSVTISEPTILAITTSVTPANSANTANGTATANVSGGTAPYIFAWADGQTVNNATGLLPAVYIVTVTDANGCESTAQVTVPISVNVSLSAQNTVLAFPNPTSGLLYLQNVPNNSQLVIINALGQVMYQSPATSAQMEISLETFAPAIYYLQIVENQQVNTIVIVKK